jgi:hypothetical protein
LLQEDVGMTVYSTPCAGFVGVFRERFSDFIVSEIAPDGTVAQLTQRNPSASLTALSLP